MKTLFIRRRSDHSIVDEVELSGTESDYVEKVEDGILQNIHKDHYLDSSEVWGTCEEPVNSKTSLKLAIVKTYSSVASKELAKAQLNPAGHMEVSVGVSEVDLNMMVFDQSFTNRRIIKWITRAAEGRGRPLVGNDAIEIKKYVEVKREQTEELLGKHKVIKTHDDFVEVCSNLFPMLL